MPSTLTKPAETLPDLTKTELEKLEKRVREGLQSFVEVGHALMEIKARRGYAIRGCKTFEEYCEKQFGFSERHGLRLMLAAETASKVEKAVGEAPRNEASARVLTNVAKDPKLLTKLQDRLEKKKLSIATATAEKLQEIVDQITPKTRAMFGDGDQPTPAERAAAPILKSMNDACPSCKTVPDNYVHQGDEWHCGHCGAPVRLNALPLEISTCKDCGKPVFGDICTSCGSVQ